MEKRFLEFCEKQDLFTPIAVFCCSLVDWFNEFVAELLHKNKERLKIHLVLALASIMDKDQNRI